MLGATAVKSAARNNLPLYLGTGIGAFVLFAGNGLNAQTLLGLGACVASVLGLRNNHVNDPTTITRVALCVWGPACALGAVGIAGPLLTAEAKASWILDVCEVPAWLRSSSGAGLLAIWAALAGAAFGLVIGDSLALTALRSSSLALHMAGAGAAWAAASMAIVRLTRSDRGHEAGRLLMSLCGLATVSAILLAMPLALSVVLLLLLAACLVATATRTRIADALLEGRV